MNTGGHPAVAALGDDRHAFGAMGVAGVNVLAAQDTATIQEKRGAVFIGVFHRIGIEILVHISDAIGTLTVMAAAKCLGFHWPVVLHPALMIYKVDVKVTEVPAAGPDEAVETLDLVHQVTDTGRFGQRGEKSDWSMHSVGALQNNVADLTVVDALGQLLECPAVTGHQSHSYFEVLRRCLLAEPEHPPAGGAIHSDRLFHENI
ncbi:MAG: hypothetical protein ACYS3N_01450 [Planctomycetota bacterium]